MNRPFDVTALRVQIDALRRDHPDVFTDEEFAADVLEGETDLFAVLDRLEGMVADAEQSVEIISARRKALASRADRYEQKATALRSLIQSLLEAASLTKVTLPTATISVRSTPPKAVVIDEDEIPDPFWRVKREVDKAALAEALKAGQDVPGAALSNGSRTLTIRRG